MIVYADRSRHVPLEEAMAPVRFAADRLRFGAVPDHACAVELMVAAAELEAAAEDALSPAEDALGTETAPLRHATRHGETVPRGTVVTTGTWCGMLAAKEGDLVRVAFDGIGEASVQL